MQNLINPPRRNFVRTIDIKVHDRFWFGIQFIEEAYPILQNVVLTRVTVSKKSILQVATTDACVTAIGGHCAHTYTWKTFLFYVWFQGNSQVLSIYEKVKCNSLFIITICKDKLWFIRYCKFINVCEELFGIIYDYLQIAKLNTHKHNSCT